MDEQLWRIRAEHSTVCPRCNGYISVGCWIVKEPEYKRWSHAVCPKDLRNAVRQPEVTEEMLKSCSFVLRVVDGKVVAEKTSCNE